MDALEELREMHVEAKAAFQKIEQANADERGGQWAKLRPQLQLHEQIEDQLVYGPMAHDAVGKDVFLSNWENQHHQQVQEAEMLIGRIGSAEPREPQWLALVQQLQTMLESHIQQEETQAWPKIRQAWGTDKLNSVGGQVKAAKAAGGVGAAISGAVGMTAEAIKNVTRRAA
jgi:hypothetical protein